MKIWLIWKTLENFQNSDGTIAGFVNLGQYSGVSRRMGDLVANVEADTSRFDVNNMIFQNIRLFLYHPKRTLIKTIRR